MTAVDLHEARFLDRDDERQRLDRLLADARAGRSGALVVRGEAGIGKSALLRYTARRAAGFRVQQIAAVEAEMELPFAGLQQLLAPVLDHLAAIPDPQRVAVETAFGATVGPPPDRFLISLAILSLLAALAEERPLLCIVDDAQWLDTASGQTLAFVARRCAAERIAMIFGVRDPIGAPQFDDLPPLAVEGLGQDDARALLERASATPLDARVRDRIVAESRGNPLALLELPRGVTSTALAGGFVVPVRGDLPRRLEGLYVERSTTLPEATRRLLLIAAADPTGSPSLLWKAAEALDVGADALGPAADAGLLEVGAAVRFPHPLARSALYRAAAPEERRGVHAALAEATDPVGDGDRRAWHRAAAATEPDEDVARDLESCSDKARARGGMAASAAFLRRAAALTPDPDRRTERALAAGQCSMQAGAFDDAAVMLTAAETEALDPACRAHVAFLRGQIAFATGRTSDAAPLLLGAAEQLVQHDADLARAAYLTGIGAAMWGGPAHASRLVEACRAALALPALEREPSAADALLEGVATLVAKGHAAAAPILRRAAQGFAGPEASVDDALRWGWFSTATSNALWDDEGLRAICARQIEIVRETGALAGAQTHLTALGTLAARSGDLAQCESWMAESAAVADATGAQIAPYNEMLVLALRGRLPEAEALIETTIEQGREHQQGMAMTVASWAASMLFNGASQFEDARQAAAAAASTPHEVFAAVWALPELIEAAVKTGAGAEARAALERLIGTTEPADTAFALGVEARCRALVADAAEADAWYRRSIELLATTRMRADLARTHLLYGEWLPRAGRHSRAREHLRTAHGLFNSMGFEGFTERARRELRESGETVGPEVVTLSPDLTAQERQIAQLARDGLSNPEIGARLFVSPRTVEWHLGRIFAKLGIRSRRSLATALDGMASGSETEPPGDRS